MLTKDSSILIVGGGIFGLSTAYHRAKAGYTKITMLEKGDAIPSPLSAGNDLNKIVRAEYEDPFYAELALSAIEELGSNPLFAPHYSQVGYLLGNSAAAPEKSKRSLAKSMASIERHPAFATQITAINSRDDVHAVASALDGPMDEWTGYFNRLAGYARAADALRSVYAAVKEMGVDVKLGRTAIIGQQITAKSWLITHIQLTPEEAAQLEGIPVTYSRDLGFFFEPDRKTGLLKISPSGAGFTNHQENGFSVPSERNDFIPPGEEEAVRKILREHLPRFADRPLVNSKICWCADTADSEYIIDFVPGRLPWKDLAVATGDSGHAFKMFPVAGVMDLLEKGKQDVERWKWKEGSNAATAEVSWREGTTRDLSELVLS
ncbi:FAD dependent oxidoreductase [Apodospora peruviana]|uniref:FAD dependent oxidoreductase n=1 Tax=Apodospora peruviana TaxID=516989 RepID=A0AAE0MEY2_9PEZI|nr:FAD dependent oxidoreductase [Apodospora peruviana]